MFNKQHFDYDVYVALVHAPGEHRHETEVQGHIIQYTQACDLCTLRSM